MARLTIEFPDRVGSILAKLAQDGQTTKADVIRRALALYEYVNREAVESKRKLSITDQQDKVLKDIVLS